MSQWIVSIYSKNKYCQIIEYQKIIKKLYCLSVNILTLLRLFNLYYLVIYKTSLSCAIHTIGNEIGFVSNMG